jgi:hypothetical protein
MQSINKAGNNFIFFWFCGESPGRKIEPSDSWVVIILFSNEKSSKLKWRLKLLLEL